MAQLRKRDKVWKWALGSAIRNGRAAEPERIADMADVSERTAREALNAIAECGWLEREVRDDGSVRFVKPEDISYEEDL